MKDNFEEICAWNAGHVITDLYKELGLDRTYYLNELAEQMGVDVDTVITWRRRERGLPVRYTHGMVMGALDAVLEQYCKNKGLLTSQKASIMAKWEERREGVRKHLKGEIEVEPTAEQIKEGVNAR